MEGNQIYSALVHRLKHEFGTEPSNATHVQIFMAASAYLRDKMLSLREKFEEEAQNTKKVSYLCMEFLLGRGLDLHLKALGIKDEFEKALSELGVSLSDIYSVERDPGTGNGGLGRLAACFMDSLAGLRYNGIGYSLLYKYGLFRQKIIGGEQKELPDNWLDYNSELLLRRNNRAARVDFGGRVDEEWHDGRMHIMMREAYSVTAEPYDYFIPGYENSAVLPLRLWNVVPESLPDKKFDDPKEYESAVLSSKFFSELTDWLYPDDSNYQGKCLRVCQQYFLVSASLQDLIAEHLEKNESLDNFAEMNSIHINDTHPAMAIPELMRLLMDVHGYEWNDAWEIVNKTMSYTNHTVLPEALECWGEAMFSRILPRIYSIICEINRRFTTSLWHDMPNDWDKIAEIAIIGGGNVRMANLSVIGSHKVNGVSEIHSQILRDSLFKSYDELYPDKFCNVTNGIAHRRWLCKANHRLTELIASKIGRMFIKDPHELSKLDVYADDSLFLEDFAHQRMQNKRDFSNFALERFGKSLDPESIFDVQIKRLHEYKRQLMNALRIISLYIDIKANKIKLARPISFIFGAKAAPGYKMAKRIIRLLWCLGRHIENDVAVRGMISVLFMDDYNVSLAERIIPAGDISEQISLAGKEASGTGNMKLMMNGAITLGTMDGANVEIFREVGEDNIFIFGMNEDEVKQLQTSGYNPEKYIKSDKIKQVLEALKIGFCGESFLDIADYLVKGESADPFMCLADFDSYLKTSLRAYEKYEDRYAWYSSSIINVSRSGAFSSDNSIREYADKIWNISQVEEQSTN
jgi:starch phosphorylase